MKKTLALLSALFVFVSIQSITAQTAEEIIDSYLETIGGKDKIAAIKSIKMTGKGQAQGMEIPVTMYQKAPSKQRLDIAFQGKEMTQLCFNGEEGWSVNFMTMKPEKWDKEQSNIMKQEADDLPDPFLNYEKKGYTVTLEGKETIEGTECHKIKLTKKPVTVEGKEVENYSYYFFDTETNVPIMEREFAKTGPAKGQASETYFSDYEEVEGVGVYFPFTISNKMNGQQVFGLTIEKIETNIEIDDALFAFPEEAAGEEEKKSGNGN